MKRKAYSRDERKAQIQTLFLIDLQRGNDGVLTANALAAHLDLTPSTKFREILEELIMDQCLVRTREDMPGVAGFRWLYSLPAHSEYLRGVLKPKKERTIRINGAQLFFMGGAS